jgi:nucleotide-binding universal stress UspA family protein
MVQLQDYKDKEQIMRLLMYYDGTDHTRDALNTVKEIAKGMNAMVHVVSSLSGWSHLEVKIIDEMENGLNYIKEHLEKERIPCETHLLVRGKNPGEDIVDVANKYQVDEIIIGTNRKTKIEKFMPGWFINHVIDRARCPVLIV